MKRLGMPFPKNSLDTRSNLRNLLEKVSFLLDAFDRHKGVVALPLLLR